ncbi:hypothetical protein F5880DRAFT_761444 [Lentinula raphanica]|nr:hypothetical protein F5880DRAFT_761444 [Lentinula raphanica]
MNTPSKKNTLQAIWGLEPMPRRTLVYQSDGTLKDRTICERCGVRVPRPCDLYRHTQRHLKGEERALRSFSCPYPDCEFKSLQKSNMDTHIRSVHTRIKNQKCPNCTYATADPGSLTRHRKRRHEYVPVFRRSRAERPATMPVPLETPGPEIIILHEPQRHRKPQRIHVTLHERRVLVHLTLRYRNPCPLRKKQRRGLRASLRY